MRLSDREAEVIRRMRHSERAAQAIHGYAVAFEGDKAAMTPGGMAREYEDSFGD